MSPISVVTVGNGWVCVLMGSVLWLKVTVLLPFFFYGCLVLVLDSLRNGLWKIMCWWFCLKIFVAGFVWLWLFCRFVWLGNFATVLCCLYVRVLLWFWLCCVLMVLVMVLIVLCRIKIVLWDFWHFLSMFLLALFSGLSLQLPPPSLLCRPDVFIKGESWPPRV